jgi:hypothetical protein
MHRKSSFTTTTQYALPTFIHIFKVEYLSGAGKLSRPSGGDTKAKRWGYRGQLVGVFQGQGQMGGALRSRSKKWWGVRALSNSLYYRAFILNVGFCNKTCLL